MLDCDVESDRLQRGFGVDRWTSLTVPPTSRPRHSEQLRDRQRVTRSLRRPNVFIKIPGAKEGVPAIEEALFAGVTVNVTLLFSREHCVAAAEAGICSVASVFVGRWDAAVASNVPECVRNRLGIALTKRT
jgi:transaldolase